MDGVSGSAWSEQKGRGSDHFEWAGVMLLNRHAFDALGSPAATKLLYEEDRQHWAEAA
jgi:hypothetical protein